MNCYLPWNLKDMTGIPAEKLRKNIGKQTSYIEMYRSELLKESIRFNIASLLRHVSLNRASFGSDEFSKLASDCLVVFLHASVFRKVAYFAPTDVENPAVGKCARNLHRLMTENVKSTMRLIDYEILLRHSQGELDDVSMQAERERIHNEVFPQDIVTDVCLDEGINNAFFTLIDMETSKAQGFMDFDVRRTTGLDEEICRKLASQPRRDENLPQSHYGIIGSCTPYLDTPFIRYNGSYYSFVTRYSLDRVIPAIAEFVVTIPFEEPEEVVVEPEYIEEPVQVEVPAPVEEHSPEKAPEAEAEAEVEEEPVPEPEPVSEPEPAPEPEPEPEPVEEPVPTEEDPEEIIAEPEMTEATAEEEDDIPFEEPENEQVDGPEEEHSMFDEDDEIESEEDETASSNEEEDSAYKETDEYEYPDEFEEDTSDQEEMPEDDVYEISEEESSDEPEPEPEPEHEVEPEEKYTALVSPDTYDYLDEAGSSEFQPDPMLEEQESEVFSYEDDDDDSSAPAEEDDGPDPYSGESLFSILDESDEDEAEEEQKDDSPSEEEPENTVIEQSFPADEEEIPFEEPEEEPESVPEPEPEAEEELPPQDESFPLLGRILRFSPSKTNPITVYFSNCNTQQKEEIVKFIEMAHKSWLLDGKDKMFAIPDTNISVALFSESHDPMLGIQRRENIGAVMYASGKDNWNSLELSYDTSGEMVKADFIRIGRSSYSDWEWKIVEKLGMRLIERRGK